jgi:predicted XRE-type DNA-binding protein
MSVSWEDLRSELIGPEDEKEVALRSSRMLAEERAHRLADARKRRHVSQRNLADAMGVSQSRVSAIERGQLDRAELSTLAAYVAALGGKLEIVADFGDEKMILG